MISVRPAQLMLGALVVLLLLLQWSIWFGSPDAFDAIALQKQIAGQKLENQGLQERNSALGAEVRDLKQGSEAIEERARSDLGMVKKDETFYQVIAPAKERPAQTPTTGGAPAIDTAPDTTEHSGASPTTRPPTDHRRDRRP